ncbi:MAG: phage major capsid protein [Hyphomonas sp.]
MTIAQLMEKRAAKLRELRQIQDAAPNGEMTTEQRAAWDAAEAEARSINEAIARQQRLDNLERAASATPVNGTGNPDFDREASRYSLTRALAHASGLKVDAAREIEVSAEIERRSGRKAQGIFAPDTVFHVRRKPGGNEQRVITSTGDGAGLIFEEARPGDFIDALRASLVTMRLGATTLSGLQGNVSIPKMTDPGATAWIAENQALSAANRDFEKVTMAPKTVGALTEFSRNMLLQSSPDIENLIRNDFAAGLARALDAAALIGGGSNEPDGIITLLTDASAMGTLDEASWSQVLGMIATIEDANAGIGSMGWAVNPRAVQTLRSTVKVRFGSPLVDDAGAGFVMESPDALAGYTAASTTALPLIGSPVQTASAIFGAWSQLLVGYWSGIDVLANPYEATAYSKGNVQVRGLLTADVAVRHIESFTAATDIPVTV